jgi:hypothetical protein
MTISIRSDSNAPDRHCAAGKNACRQIFQAVNLGTYYLETCESRFNPSHCFWWVAAVGWHTLGALREQPHGQTDANIPSCADRPESTPPLAKDHGRTVISLGSAHVRFPALQPIPAQQHFQRAPGYEGTWRNTAWPASNHATRPDKIDKSAPTPQKWSSSRCQKRRAVRAAVGPVLLASPVHFEVPQILILDLACRGIRAVPPPYLAPHQAQDGTDVPVASTPRCEPVALPSACRRSLVAHCANETRGEQNMPLRSRKLNRRNKVMCWMHWTQSSVGAGSRYICVASITSLRRGQPTSRFGLPWSIAGRS